MKEEGDAERRPGTATVKTERNVVVTMVVMGQGVRREKGELIVTRGLFQRQRKHNCDVEEDDAVVREKVKTKTQL